MFPLNVKLLILLIFLSGCVELTTTEVSVVPVEEGFVKEDSNQTFDISSISFLDPEDRIDLLDGNKLVYKGNVSVRSVDSTEWKATFFLNDDPEQRYNLSLNESLLIGETEIIVREFNTYKEGSVGIEIK